MKILIFIIILTFVKLSDGISDDCRKVGVGTKNYPLEFPFAWSIYELKSVTCDKYGTTIGQCRGVNMFDCSAEKPYGDLYMMSSNGNLTRVTVTITTFDETRSGDYCCSKENKKDTTCTCIQVAVPSAPSPSMSTGKRPDKATPSSRSGKVSNYAECRSAEIGERNVELKFDFIWSTNKRNGKYVLCYKDDGFIGQCIGLMTLTCSVESQSVDIYRMSQNGLSFNIVIITFNSTSSGIYSCIDEFNEQTKSVCIQATAISTGTHWGLDIRVMTCAVFLALVVLPVVEWRRHELSTAVSMYTTQ